MSSQSMAIALCTGSSESQPNLPDFRNPLFWNDNWSDDFCFNTFDNIMFTGPQRTYDPVALRETVQPNMQLVLNRFNGMYIITEPDNRPTGEFSPAQRAAAASLQDRILSACRRLPGACDNFLTGPLLTLPSPPDLTFPMSAPFCQNLTRADIADCNASLQFCGCFSPPIVSQKVQQEVGVKSCDPLCQRVDTVQLPNGMGGFLKCPDDTVCVISDISITAAESEVGGSVNFEQICNCTSNCRCVIESEMDINQTLSKIGLSGNFEQLCGQNSACVLFNPATNTDTFVTCPDSQNTNNNNNDDNQRATILFWSIGVILVVVIIIITLFVSLNIADKR